MPPGTDYEALDTKISDGAPQNAEKFYNNSYTADFDEEEIELFRKKMIASLESGRKSIITAPEGFGKNKAISKALEGEKAGFIDLKLIKRSEEDSDNLPKDSDFIIYPENILEREEEFDFFVIMNCSLLRKEELTKVLDLIENFSGKENKILQSWNYSEFLGLKFEHQFYLEKYAEELISPPKTLENKHFYDNPLLKKIIKESIYTPEEFFKEYNLVNLDEASETRENILEVLTSGWGNNFGRYRVTSFDAPTISEMINSTYNSDLKRSTVSTHLSKLRDLELISKKQEGRKVKYRLQNPFQKLLVESYLFSTQ